MIFFLLYVEWCFAFIMLITVKLKKKSKRALSWLISAVHCTVENQFKSGSKKYWVSYIHEIRKK